MQTAGRDVGPIKANSYMQNSRMSARTWDNIDIILHRIIIIAWTLREDRDGDDARTKLQTLHEDVCQDQALGPAFLARFNQYFDIANIHDSEYKYYFRRTIDGTDHTQLKTSMCDYFCEELDRQERAAGGAAFDRARMEKLFLDQDKSLAAKASLKKIRGGYLPKDTRAEIFRENAAPAKRTPRTASAAVGDQATWDTMRAEVKKSGVKAAERAAAQAVAAILAMDNPGGSDSETKDGWQRLPSIGLTGYDVPQDPTTAGNATAAVGSGFESTVHWREM